MMLPPTEGKNVKRVRGLGCSMIFMSMTGGFGLPFSLGRERGWMDAY